MESYHGISISAINSNPANLSAAKQKDYFYIQAAGLVFSSSCKMDALKIKHWGLIS